MRDATASTALEALELHPVSIPLKYRFRRVDRRDAVLIGGPQGWGEFSPFPDYPPEVTTRWLAAALEAACSVWPTPVRSSVPINVTVPAVDGPTAFAIVAGSGCRTAKVKVADPGQSAKEDEERIAAVRSALGPSGKIRIDVNGAWDLATATATLLKFASYDLEYVEQPVRTLEEMIELRRRVPMPIAADEAVRLAADPLEVAERGAADLIVLKVQPLGGVERALEVARRSGLPAVVSSALETSIGIAAGLAAAAALPQLDYACGLGTVSLFTGDVVLDSLVPIDGQMDLRRPEPDPELVDRFAADRDTSAELLRRLRWAAEVLT
ncbi:MAG TPA: o-succinylbenzoate synthase [Acidimicrobiia bacterium]|nr:o-succinylbenzoate synthase [Acidimicrobiia bacterium]